MKLMTKAQQRERRHARSRARMTGTTERPRLVLQRSLRNFYGQVVNDETGVTIVGLHSKSTKLEGDAGERTGRVAQAYLLGKAIGEKAKEAGVSKVVFDRAGNRYHGRVAAFAEGARDGGLEF